MKKQGMERIVSCATLWLVVAAAAIAAEDPFANVAAEMAKELGEGFFVERSGIFVVAANITRTELKRFQQETIDKCAQALWKDFFDKKPEGPIRVYLFRDKQSYEAWVPKLAGFAPRTPFGFYLPQKQALMMNISTGGGTLVHEMTHVLTDADFPGCPTWFFEGLGSLFEQCHVDRDGHIKGLVNWRLPVLKKGGFIPLETLVKTTTAAFRGEKEPLHYANARYLCLYLQERGLLPAFYKTFRDAHKAGADDTGWASLEKATGEEPDAFEKKWHAWVETQQWP